jgi:uncharacterized protein (DUF697 family)
MTTEREAGAMKIVRAYVAMSAGAALIPLALVDVTILAGIHVALIKKLCDHYGIEFSQDTARGVLVAILASLIPGSFSSLAGRKVLGMLPVAAHVFGSAAMSALSAAVSYLLGRVFIRHFEAGGTLHDFDVEHLHRLWTQRSA